MTTRQTGLVALVPAGIALPVAPAAPAAEAARAVAGSRLSHQRPAPLLSLQISPPSSCRATARVCPPSPGAAPPSCSADGPSPIRCTSRRPAHDCHRTPSPDKHDAKTHWSSFDKFTTPSEDRFGQSKQSSDRALVGGASHFATGCPNARQKRKTALPATAHRPAPCPSVSL